MGSQRIQMNVTDQLPKIRVLIADDGVITVLEQMPVAKRPKVVGDGITGEKASHEFRKT